MMHHTFAVALPAPELMSQVSGLSKLIAILIALPHLRAQKQTSHLNISAMLLCVLRNDWLSFANTQFSPLPHSAHVVFSGYFCSPYSRITRSYICYLHKIIFMTAQKFYRRYEGVQKVCCVAAVSLVYPP